MKLSLRWVGSARSALVRFAAWRWTKPLWRAALIVGGLVALGLLGRATLAGAAGPPADIAAGSTASPPQALPDVAAAVTGVPAAVAIDAGLVTPAAAASPPPAEATAAGAELHRGPATPEDPVIMNQATAEDFHRLPGIGAKRAYAIMALRTRLGRFRQIEDLLKVKGIGMKTLKRLRPLLRVDAPAIPADAGAD